MGLTQDRPTGVRWTRGQGLALSSWSISQFISPGWLTCGRPSRTWPTSQRSYEEWNNAYKNSILWAEINFSSYDHRITFLKFLPEGTCTHQGQRGRGRKHPPKGVWSHHNLLFISSLVKILSMNTHVPVVFFKLQGRDSNRVVSHVGSGSFNYLAHRLKGSNEALFLHPVPWGLLQWSLPRWC